MEETLTRERFDTMLQTIIPSHAFNEIWCSEEGLLKLRKLIHVPVSSVYKKIDYLSFIVTPVKVRNYFSDNKIYLMQKVSVKAPGTIVPESYRIVEVISLE